MTDCTRFEDDLKAYADGELPLLLRLAIRLHLSRCPSCQKEILAMTQISEDFRAADPKDALPPTLREKLLADVPLAPNNGGTGEERESLPSDSSIIGGGGASRKRRAPAWIYVAAAIAAWFVCFPLFQHIRENSRPTIMLANPAPMAAYRQAAPVPIKHHSLAAAQSFDVNGAVPPMPASALPPPKAPPLPDIPAPLPAPSAPTGNFTVRLSDREAGANDAIHIQVPPDTDLDTQRQVHKEAGIGIQVRDPEATGDKLSQMVQETGGYVAANTLSTGDDGLKSGEMIVKVPVTQFDTFLAQVAKLGVVESKNISGEDITEKTSDATQAQIVQESDLQKAESRLKALGSHAKWEDTQNAEDLRVQLAQTRARLKLLKRMAALGTLTIDLSQTPKAALPPPVTNGFTGSLKATTHDALLSLVGSASALLALVIWLLAYAPIWLPLLLIGRYAMKEYRKREAASPEA